MGGPKMRTIKETIISAVIAVLFVAAVSVLMFAGKERNRLRGIVFKEDRLERLLTEAPAGELTTPDGRG